MRNKTLRRRIIMREYDYEYIIPEIIKNDLYDRADFIPLTLNEMKNENLMFRIKNPEKGEQEPWPITNINHISLWHLQHLCYNKQYTKWKMTVDYPDGQVWLQSRSNVNPSRLGWGWFEKDI